MRAMPQHARKGHRAQRRERNGPAAPVDAPAQSPLDFAECVFRDPAQPMALRASLAKAAMPYVHGRWCPIGSDPRDAQVGSTRLASLNDAKPKLSPPFDLPDPYGSLRADWREALERAGLIPAQPAAAPPSSWPGERSET